LLTVDWRLLTADWLIDGNQFQFFYHQIIGIFSVAGLPVFFLSSVIYHQIIGNFSVARPSVIFLSPGRQPEC